MKEGASRWQSLVKKLPDNAGDVRETGLIPGSGRSPVGGMATYSSILAWRIPMDAGTWRAIVHSIMQSQTWLKQLSMHASEISQPKRTLEQLIPTIQHPGKGATMEMVKIQWFPEIRRREGWIGRAQKMWGAENTVYDTIMVDRSHFNLSNHRLYNAKSEITHTINLRWWRFVTVGSILVKKYTTLVENIDKDGQGVYGKSLYHPFNFVVNLKWL